MSFFTSFAKYRFLHIWIVVLFLLAVSPSSFAVSIMGTVTNKTTNRPDVNDEIVLIALTQNMQEVARTRTDGSGHYSINVPDPGMHLIRVDHQKAAYFAAIAPGTTKVDVIVYDVALAVKGIETQAVMARIETDGQDFTSSKTISPRTIPRRQELSLAPRPMRSFCRPTLN